jgi:hypothetical protein
MSVEPLSKELLQFLFGELPECPARGFDDSVDGGAEVSVGQADHNGRFH